MNEEIKHQLEMKSKGYLTNRVTDRFKSNYLLARENLIKGNTNRAQEYFIDADFELINLEKNARIRRNGKLDLLREKLLKLTPHLGIRETNGRELLQNLNISKINEVLQKCLK